MGVSDMRFLGLGITGLRPTCSVVVMVVVMMVMMVMVMMVDTIQEPDTSVERVGSAVEAALAKCSA